MTVAELIKKLQQFHPDAKVKIEFTNCCGDYGVTTEREDAYSVNNDGHTPTVTPSPYDANVHDEDDIINYLPW